MNGEIWLSITFIIASWAYLQQSPTCTRVNNLVYIFSDLTPMASRCWSCFTRERGLSKDLTLQVYLYLHLYASLILQWVRITHSPMRWLCIYLVSWWDLNSSARINVTTITKMELHSTRILGNSPSLIKNSLTQKYSSYLLSPQQYT